MTDTCEVVTIETKNGPVEINKADYDEKKHMLAGQNPAEKASKKSAKKK